MVKEEVSESRVKRERIAGKRVCVCIYASELELDVRRKSREMGREAEDEEMKVREWKGKEIDVKVERGRE